MPKTSTKAQNVDAAPVVDLKEKEAAIAALDVEIADLTTAIENFSLEDEAEARNVVILPKPSDLFSQIQAAIEAKRAEESAEAARKLRLEARQATVTTLESKKLEREQLRQQIEKIHTQIAAESERNNIQELMEQYADLAAKLTEVGRQLWSAPRSNLDRARGGNREPFNGSPIAPTIGGTPESMSFNYTFISRQ